MNTQAQFLCVHLPGPEHPGMDDVAHALYTRNAGEYADPALTELAWLDECVRDFWRSQAEAIRADLEHLARHGCVAASSPGR